MIKQFVKIIWSVLLLIAAIIGFFVPLVPGTLFLILAIAVFSPEHGRKMKKWIQEKAKKKTKSS